MNEKLLEQRAGEYAEKHAFRVPYDGSNKFYDDVDFKASKDGYIAGATEETKLLSEHIRELQNDKGKLIDENRKAKDLIIGFMDYDIILLTRKFEYMDLMKRAEQFLGER